MMTTSDHREVIVIQKDATFPVAVPTDFGNVSTSSVDQLENGTCWLRIESMTEEHIGSWSCILVDQAGAVSTGQVNVSLEQVTNSIPILEFEPTIYYGTDNGLHAYSLTTSKTKELVPSDTVVKGVAYDPIRDVIYWSEYNINMEFHEETQDIYSGRRDGTGIHFLYNTEQYAEIEALGFDWLTGNLYACTRRGTIFVCSNNTGCVTILKGDGDFTGIALNPNEGIMFWTAWVTRKDDSIYRADMDGSHPTRLVAELRGAKGITIDFQSSRLYWTSGHSVQSSTRQGTDVRTVIQGTADTYPYGIAVFGDKMYWSDYVNRQLETGSRTGQDIRVLHVAHGLGYYMANSRQSPFKSLNDPNKPLRDSQLSQILRVDSNLIQVYFLMREGRRHETF